MPRNTLNRQLSNIQDEILILGSMVEQATLQAVGTLKSHDIKKAREVFEQDQIINEKRFAIENAILISMATQQPMARDLRALAALLEVNTELERMADRVSNICERTVFIATGELFEMDGMDEEDLNV